MNRILLLVGAAYVLYFAYSWFYRRVLCLQSLQQLHVGEPITEVVGRDQVAAAFFTSLAPYARRLEALGFVELGTLRVLSSLRVDGLTVAGPVWIFLQTGSRTIAELQNVNLGEAGHRALVAFLTDLADGRPVVTTNGVSSTVHPTALRRTRQTRALTLEGHYEDHLQAVAAVGVQPIEAPATIEAMAATEHDHGRRRHLELEASGLLVDDGQGKRRFSTDYLRQLVSGWLAAREEFEAFVQRSALEVGASPAVARESEVDQFRQDLRNRDLRAKARLGTFVLFASLLVFILAYVAANRLARLSEIALLAGVIALHELGHYMAMRTFGFRNVRVFFLPLLGAATAGEKEDASDGEWIWVYLAGPVPGILLGTVLLLRPWAGRGGLAEIDGAAILLVGLNVANLLPIAPLDGGRLLQLVFLGRRPRATFVFDIASAVTLGACAVLMEMPPWMRVGFALAPLGVLVSLAHRIRVMRVGLRLEAAPATVGERRDEAIFRALHAGEERDLPLPNKFAIVREILSAPAPRKR